MVNSTQAIVIDARYRMSLPIIRSLGEHSIVVTCTDMKEYSHDKKSLGFYSKYTNSTAMLPSPEDNEIFLTSLQSLCTQKSVLFPVGIDTLFELSKNQERISSFANILLPEYNQLNLANDKTKLISFAAQHGIPCPDTTTLMPDESILQLSTRVSYPAVIKYSAGELLRLDPKDRYAIIRSEKEFISTFQTMHSLQPYPLVQSYVEGGGFGVSAVFDQQGQPHTVFCHRRIREYPISGGPSCLCVSDWNEGLVEQAISLLKALKWRGVAMVEFKGNKQQGYKLMEINPRFWGSLALAPIAGCDIPYAYYCCANGELAEKHNHLNPSYKIGQKMRFLIQDTLSLPHYAKVADQKISYVLKHIASLVNPTIRDGVFSFCDPKPGWYYLKQAIKKKDKILR